MFKKLICFSRFSRCPEDTKFIRRRQILLQRKNDFHMTKKGAEAPLIKYI